MHLHTPTYFAPQPANSIYHFSNVIAVRGFALLVSFISLHVLWNRPYFRGFSMHHKASSKEYILNNKADNKELQFIKHRVQRTAESAVMWCFRFNPSASVSSSESRRLPERQKWKPPTVQLPWLLEWALQPLSDLVVAGLWCEEIREIDYNFAYNKKAISQDVYPSLCGHPLGSPLQTDFSPELLPETNRGLHC